MEHSKLTFLNDIEKVELKRFADNSTLSGAVKKVLLRGVYFEGNLTAGEPANPINNFALSIAAMAHNKPEVSDEQIGRDLRAAWMGISLIENGFNEVDKFKTEKIENKTVKNQAR